MKHCVCAVGKEYCASCGAITRKDGHFVLIVSSLFPSALDNLKDIMRRNSKDSTLMMFDGLFILQGLKCVAKLSKTICVPYLSKFEHFVNIPGTLCNYKTRMRFMVDSGCHCSVTRRGGVGEREKSFTRLYLLLKYFVYSPNTTKNHFTVAVDPLDA